MEVTINTLTEVQQEADIQVSHEELEPHFQDAYERFRPKAQLRGFRKGKVPMELVRKLYGEAIEQDALDSIAGTLYRQVMEERDIQPVGRPALTDMSFQRGSYFRFKIKYDVKPEIKLKKYKGVSVEKAVHAVGDEEVDREILQVRRVNSAHSAVELVTDTDHIVTTEVQELDDTGAPLIGKKKTGVKFDLSDASLVNEVKTALQNAEKGGVYRVTMASGEADRLQQTQLALTVTGVEKVELPPLDDALVQKVTGEKISTLDEFTQTIRTDLTRYWEDQSNTRLRDAIADEIVRTHEFTVPDSMVDAFLDSFLDDIKNRSQDKTLPGGFDEQKFREENRAYAIWQAKWMLLKEKIGEVENITVTEKDIVQLAEEEAEHIGVPKDRLAQYYKSSGAVRDRLLSERVISFLREHAKIREKAFDPHAAYSA
ncbi:MAG: trigger factor [Bacteroidota bacterium]